VVIIDISRSASNLLLTDAHCLVIKLGGQAIWSILREAVSRSPSALADILVLIWRPAVRHFGFAGQILGLPTTRLWWKVDCNRISRFDNTKVWIFGAFCL